MRKAIAEGRIKIEPDGTIDPQRADLAWRANSDAADHEPAFKPVPQKSVEDVRSTLRDAGEPVSSGGMTLLQARTANEVLRAQDRRVRLQKLRGELVDRARAVATVFSLARRERDAWVGWPARVSALIAAELECDPHRVEQVLDAHVRRHLDELSELAIEFR